MPCNEAIYLLATDKIYGVAGNQILKFNASTVAMESTGAVCSPMEPPMRICTDGTNLYVSSYMDRSLNASGGSPFPPTNKQIWTVNPTTLAVSNTLGLDTLWQAYFSGTLDICYSTIAGPMAMKVLNGYIYFIYTSDNSGGAQLLRINLSNPLDNEVVGSFSSASGSYQYPELFDMWTDSGTDYWAYPWADNQELAFGYIDNGVWFTKFHLSHAPSCAPYSPTACVYVSSNNSVYIVSGSDAMHRYNVGPNTVTVLNLGPVLTNGMPTRIRRSPLNNKLYIPSQSDDSIIVWDTTTESGILKSGFDSPIDVVFTTTKSFAVQTGRIGLKEIT